VVGAGLVAWLVGWCQGFVLLFPFHHLKPNPIVVAHVDCYNRVLHVWHACMISSAISFCGVELWTSHDQSTFLNITFPSPSIQRSHWSQFFAVQERMTYMFRNLSVSWQTGDWQVRLYTDAETWKLMGGLQSFRAKPYFLFLWHLFQMEPDHMHDKNMFLVINYCWIRCCFQNIIKEACHEIWKNLMDDLSHNVRHFHMPPRLSKP
jgi:hypothetical protein